MTTQFIIVNRYDGELYEALNVKRFYKTSGLAQGTIQKQIPRSGFLLTVLEVKLGADPSVEQVAKFSGFTVQEFDAEVAAFREVQLDKLASDKECYLPKHAGEKWVLDEMQRKEKTIAMLESMRYEDLIYK